MRNRAVWLATLAALSLAFLLGQVTSKSQSAEETGDSKSTYRAPESLRVATIDIAVIFRGSESFKAKMVQMKKKVDTAETTVKEQHEKIGELVKQIKQPAPVESPTIDHVKQLEKLLTEAIAAEKDKFMKEEAAIYNEMSRSIDRQIEQCARRHGIHLVLRINKDPVNPNDRNDILRGINRPINYVDPQLDITEEVLAAVNAEPAN